MFYFVGMIIGKCLEYVVMREWYDLGLFWHFDSNEMRSCKPNKCREDMWIYIFMIMSKVIKE